MANQTKEIIDVPTAPSNALVQTGQQDDFARDVQRVLAQKIALQGLMKNVLHDETHYGTIPGTSKPGEKPKKSLYKAGAETICLLFRLRPEYEVITRREEGDFLAFEVRCRLYHIPTGELWGEGTGSVNSRESRYLNQITAKLCPECGKPAIIKGREDYGGGWVCFAKKDGCGAKFTDNDERIITQTGTVNPAKVWELHNTLIKMGQKRAHVAATLTATAASDFFTQDLEDLEEAAEGREDAVKTTTTVKEAEKPAATPKASAVQIRDLNEALKELGIGRDIPESVTGDARKEKLKAAKMAWVNGMLTDHGVDKVETCTDLTPDLAIKLTAAAKAGDMPQEG